MNKDDQISKRKALFGLSVLIVTLGLLLFIPAWTLDFWQAWVYLFIYTGSSLMITLFLIKYDMKLLKLRLKAGPAAEKEKSQKVIHTFARFTFIGVMLIPGFDHRLKWSNVPIYLVIAGEIFVLLGFFIIFHVFKENSYTSATIEIAENQTVISTGPYAVVRHPMYSGALLMLLFTPLALGTYWDLICVILFFVVIIWRVLDEEKFLSINLSGYTAYCQKTRFRLIPMIW